jgi:transcriptional regulator with XRE-family HTH domain
MLERIKRLCEEQGMTVADLEKKIGFGSGRIGHWKDSVPKADSLLAVANALGVTVEYLLTGETKNPAPTDGDGLENKLTFLSPGFLEKLDRFLELAQADLETAERFLSFAVQELESSQQWR